MKKELYSIAIFSLVFLSLNAQEQKPVIDQGKKHGTTSPSIQHVTKLFGEANVKGIDPLWSPILTQRVMHSEPRDRDEAIIERIKEEKNLLKQQQSGYQNYNTQRIETLNPVIGTNFQGNPNNGGSPLDNDMAVSNGGWIVSVSNTIIEFYDLLGVSHFNQDLVTFLNDVNITNVCDPVVLYDAGSDRFILFCQDNPLQSNDRIAICFSKTNNPMNGWWVYEETGDPLSNGDGFDYPKIAVSTNELFLTGNLYHVGGFQPFDQAVVYQFDKTQGYAGASMNWINWSAIANAPFTLLPVSSGQGSNYGPGIYLVSTDAAGGSNIYLYDITNDQYHSPVMNSFIAGPVAYSVAGDATQSGTTCKLKTNDCRALSGFFLGGVIHFVFNCDIGGGWCGINYNRLDVASVVDNSTQLGRQGTQDYSYPAVVSYAKTPTNPSVIIGFGLTGPATFPAIGVVECDSVMNWSPSTSIARKGDGYVKYTSNSLERWGDYTGATRQHSNPPSVWICGMYGTLAHDWSTWIANIDQISGINTITNNQNSLKVYPNPVVKTFNVDFSLNAPTDLTISVMDITGKTVKELYTGKGRQGDNTFSFNAGNLSKGIYFLSIKNNSEVIKNEKIVIAE